MLTKGHTARVKMGHISLLLLVPTPIMVGILGKNCSSIMTMNNIGFFFCTSYTKSQDTVVKGTMFLRICIGKMKKVDPYLHLLMSVHFFV